MMAADQRHAADPRHARHARIAQLGTEVRRGRLGHQQRRRTGDRAQTVADLGFRHAHCRRQRQPCVAAPLEAALDRTDAALDQQPRTRFVQRGDTGLHPRDHRDFRIVEHALALAVQRAALAHRVAQPRCGGVLGAGQRAQRFDQIQVFDALRRRRGQHAGDRAAHRMPKQRESRPAQRIGSGQHIENRAEHAVFGIRRVMEAAAVAGHVQRDQIVGRQRRRHRPETRGIVQPAVQRQQRQAAAIVFGQRAVVAQPAEAAARGVQREIAHHAAPRRCRRASAANASACAGEALRQGM